MEDLGYNAKAFWQYLGAIEWFQAEENDMMKITF